MTWTISFTAPNKDVAKRDLVLKLAAAMLPQKPHARDFDLVKSAFAGAIDLCAEGAITVAGGGHLSGQWVDEDIPHITGVSISSLSVSSTATTG